MKVLKFIGEVYLYAIATVVLVAVFVIQECLIWKINITVVLVQKIG